jgi:organic hydroperoxide reductase OsmC/OhrA
MSTLKDFHFEVDASPLAGHRVRLTSAGKRPLEAAVPPEFRGGTPGMWSPEDLLVAAVAACYAVTLDSLAERRHVGLREVDIRAAGHVTRRAEGRLGFVAIELAVRLYVDPGAEQEASHVARDAHQVCLVSHALDVPVELELDVRAEEAPRPPACSDAVTAVLAKR